MKIKVLKSLEAGLSKLLKFKSSTLLDTEVIGGMYKDMKFGFNYM